MINDVALVVRIVDEVSGDHAMEVYLFGALADDAEIRTRRSTKDGPLCRHHNPDRPSGRGIVNAVLRFVGQLGDRYSQRHQVGTGRDCWH